MLCTRPGSNNFFYTFIVQHLSESFWSLKKIGDDGLCIVVMRFIIKNNIFNENQTIYWLPLWDIILMYLRAVYWFIFFAIKTPCRCWLNLWRLDQSEARFCRHDYGLWESLTWSHSQSRKLRDQWFGDQLKATFL